MKKVLDMILRSLVFPIIYVWVALAVVLVKLGDGLHWLGNKMTGDRIISNDLSK